MAKTNKIVTEGVQTDYTSVIVSYSNGIDSTGALYWALREFDKSKIFLLYCDTGFEYPENIKMFYKTAAFIGIRPVLLQHPKGFLNLLLEERLKWPDMKNRWCTAYLKTGVTDHWIRTHRDILGSKCLFISESVEMKVRGVRSFQRLSITARHYGRSEKETSPAIGTGLVWITRRVKCLSRERSYTWNRIFVMNTWGVVAAWLVCL